MKNLPQYTRINEVRLGQNAYFDAWLYNMMIDNNIAYQMNPDIIAAPEQIAFMVALEKDQVYLPCSDETFAMLLAPLCPPILRQQYNRAWRVIVHLVRSMETDPKTKRHILECCRYRFRTFMQEGQHTVIPSRAVKRMTSLVFALSGHEDPWLERRREHNRTSQALLDAAYIQRALGLAPQEALRGDMAEIRRELNHMELARLFYLSAMSRPWLAAEPSPLSIDAHFTTGVQAAQPLRTLFGTEDSGRRTVLFLCDADGGVIFDIALIARLLLMGMRVIMAVKAGFFFYAPTITDADTDPVLHQCLGRAHIVHDNICSKNELLRLLREHRFLVISDGTRERLNLYRTSTTFARAWKEADIIIAKGWRHAEILLGSSQHFTRDILCYWLDTHGEYRIQAKARAHNAHKYSETALKDMADQIISQMRAARRAGKTVMFYSCIIGSIPGQTNTAIQVARVFVEHLRKRLDDAFIINPTEHFADGLDGDDLMFMWERVQRSGVITVWRFQTVQDIEDSFALLDRKIPPSWSGKDATYSTGCTKEMRIALDVQRHNREMQIIGPDAKRFFRRNEYGVGKYFDATIEQ